MDYRNARYLEDGRIDCDIDHPVYGWIPFTANPADVEPFGRELHAEIHAAGTATPYTAPAEP